MALSKEQEQALAELADQRIADQAEAKERQDAIDDWLEAHAVEGVIEEAE